MNIIYKTTNIVNWSNIDVVEWLKRELVYPHYQENFIKKSMPDVSLSYHSQR